MAACGTRGGKCRIERTTTEQYHIEHRGTTRRTAMHADNHNAFAAKHPAEEFDRKVIATDPILPIRAGIEDRRQIIAHVVYVVVGRRKSGRQVVVLGPDKSQRRISLNY